MAIMFPAGMEVGAIEPTVFAVTMVCLDEVYETQATDFLQEGGC